MPRDPMGPVNGPGPTGAEDESGDRERGARIALAGLDGMGPARMRWLLSGGSAAGAWQALCRGQVPTDAPWPRGVSPALIAGWSRRAADVDPDALVRRHREAGVVLIGPDDPDWPFVDDPDPPALLYLRGHRQALAAAVKVAIVGTRRCSDVGRGVAAELGRVLTEAGVSVVSGLALGIDGAAHKGAVAASSPSSPPGPPVAVVATGLDSMSPRAHGRLAAEVAARGAVISESPLGIAGDRWRFPARNRLIAGLADLVIVVESHQRGGALITVDEANERSTPVAAVPGSIRSAASAGTNRLLADGALALCDIDDVFTMLGIDRLVRPGAASGSGLQPPVDPLEALIWREVGARPLSVDQLCAVSGRVGEGGLAPTFAEVVVAVQRLVARGLVRQIGSTVTRVEDGGWAP